MSPQTPLKKFGKAIPAFLFLFLFFSLSVSGLEIEEIENGLNRSIPTRNILRPVLSETEELNIIKLNANPINKHTHLFNSDSEFDNEYGEIQLKDARFFSRDNVAIGKGIVSVSGGRSGLSMVTMNTPMPNTAFSIISYDGITSDKNRVRRDGEVLHKSVMSDENGDVTYFTYHFSTQILSFPDPLVHSAGGEATGYFLDFFFEDYDRMDILIDTTNENLRFSEESVYNEFPYRITNEPECCSSIGNSSYDVNFINGASSSFKLLLTSYNVTSDFDMTMTVEAYDDGDNSSYVTDSFQWELELSEEANVTLSQTEPLPNITMYVNQSRNIFLNNYVDNFDEWDYVTFEFYDESISSLIVLQINETTLFGNESHDEYITANVTVDLDGLGDDVGVHIVSFDEEFTLSAVEYFIVALEINDSLTTNSFEIDIQGTPAGGGNVIFYDGGEGTEGDLWTSLQDGQAVNYVSVSPSPSNGSNSIKFGLPLGTNRGSWSNTSGGDFINGTRTVQFKFYDGGGYTTSNKNIRIHLATSIASYIPGQDGVGMCAFCGNVNPTTYQIGNLSSVSTMINTTITRDVLGTWHDVKMVYDNDNGNMMWYYDGVNNANASFLAGQNLKYIKLGYGQIPGYWAVDDLMICEGDSCEGSSEPPVSPPNFIQNFPNNVSLEYEDTIYFDFNDYLDSYESISIEFTPTNASKINLTATNSTTDVFNSSYVNFSLVGTATEIQWFITNALSYYNSSMILYACNGVSCASEAFVFEIDAPVIEPVPPTNINNIDNQVVEMWENITLNMGAYFTNYERIDVGILDTLNGTQNLSFSLNDSIDYYETENIYAELSQSGINIVLTIKAKDTNLSFVFDVDAINAYGEASNAFQYTISPEEVIIVPDPTATDMFSDAISGVFGVFFGIIDGLFPEESTLTIQEKFTYILITIALTFIILVLIGITAKHEMAIKGAVYLSFVLSFFEILYFVSIEYISIGLIIILLLIGIGIGYIMVKSNGD